MKIGTRGWLAVQGAVSVTLLALLARNIDLGALRGLFGRIPVSFYLASLVVVLSGQMVYAWRWRLLLGAAGVHVPFGDVARQYFVGIFVNNFLPSTVGGDVAKIYYLGQSHGFRTIGASVVLDRLLGLGLLALLATTALAMSPVRAPRLTAALLACAALTAAAVTLLMLTGYGTGGLPGRVVRFGARAVRVAERLQRMRLDMAAPLAQPSIIARAALVVVGYSLALTVIYMQFVALQDTPAPPVLAMFAVVTATAVLSNVPISLNGLGLREQLHASLLAPLAVAPETAVAISLLLYAHLLIASLVGLVLWLRAPRRAPLVPPEISGG